MDTGNGQPINPDTGSQYKDPVPMPAQPTPAPHVDGITAAPAGTIRSAIPPRRPYAPSVAPVAPVAVAAAPTPVAAPVVAPTPAVADDDIFSHMLEAEYEDAPLTDTAPLDMPASASLFAADQEPAPLQITPDDIEASTSSSTPPVAETPVTPVVPSSVAPTTQGFSESAYGAAPSEPATQPQPAPAKKRFPLWAMLLIGAALLGALGGGVYAAMTMLAPAAVNSSSSTVLAPAVTKRTVKVGMLQPFSGDTVSVGNDRKRAVEFARKTLNLQDVDIQMVYADDNNCDTATVTKAVTDMIVKDKVIAIIGDDCSSSTLAAAKIAEAQKVVLISSSATSPEITLAGDYVFRTVPSDAQQGKFAAELIYKRGHKKLAIAHEDGAYGQGLSSALKKSFEALGGSVVDTQEFKSATLDVAAPINRIASSKPDAVYLVSSDFGTDTSLMLAIKSAKITAPIFGAESMKNPIFTKDAGANAEGLTITAVTDGTAAFQSRFRAEYGIAPTDYIAQTYDAYYALAMAIKAGAATGSELQKALIATSFDGASQKIAFDANGDVSATYEVVVIKGGAFIPATN